jgi:hypothetical protein
MSYLVTVTFDLHGVAEKDREEVYKKVYTAFGKIGLFTTAKAGTGEVVPLPQSTAIGKRGGESEANVANKVLADVKQAFETNQNPRYTVLVTVGTRWAWSQTGAKDVTGSASGIP